MDALEEFIHSDDDDDDIHYEIINKYLNKSYNIDEKETFKRHLVRLFLKIKFMITF